MLHPDILTCPLAHRGLHDRGAGRIENSTTAISTAIEAGYGIELDLQLSADGHAMVFHDYDLGRLTKEAGAIRQRSADALRQIELTGSTDKIPTLEEVLDLVASQAPLLLELKDQDGALGPNIGALEDAVIRDLSGYDGPVAVMSFNPYSMIHIAKEAPSLTRGLTTGPFRATDWGLVPQATRERLRDIPDFEASGASFISHDVRDLQNPAVARLKERGIPVLCWTVRSTGAEAAARRIADNVTFEGYFPA